MAEKFGFPPRKKFLIGLLRLVFISAVATPAYGEQSPDIEEEILVTGSRLSQPAAQPNGLTLGAVAIRNQAPVSALEALQYTPGVYVSQPGGRGGVASISIRGAESNFVVVQVDGQQLNDPTNTRGGSFDFSTVDINEVKRIEILRGAAAAVYGSDALAGVINIITYDPGIPETRISLSAGQDSLRQLGLSVTTRETAFGLFHVAASATEDDNPAADTSFESLNARLNYEKRWNDQFLAARFSVAGSEQLVFPEDSGGREFAVLRDRDDRQADAATAALSYRADLSPALSLQTDASYFYRKEKYASPGIAGGARNPFGVPENSSDSEFDRTSLSAFLEYQHSEFDVVVGSQWQREDGSADGEIAFIGSTIFELQRDTVGVFAEAFKNLTDQLHIGVSVRADKADGEALETTYRVNSEFAVSDNALVFANVGSGYKLPSFFALGNPLVGNPELQPEKVRNYEIGVTGEPVSGLTLEFSGFFSRYKNLIDFDPELFTNLNRSNVTMSGWDLSLTGQAVEGKLDYRVFFSYVDIDLKPGGTLRQRPQWRWGGSLGYSIAPSLRVTLNWQHNDERFDSSIPNPAVVLDDYLRIDFAAHWQVHDRVRLTLAADNLLDESYADADGFAGNGRRGRVKVEWRI